MQNASDPRSSKSSPNGQVLIVPAGVPATTPVPVSDEPASGRFSAQPAYDIALARVARALEQRRQWHAAGLPARVVAIPNLLAWGQPGSGKTEGVLRLCRVTGIPLLSLDLPSAVVRDDGMDLQTLFGQGLALHPGFFSEVRIQGVGVVVLEGVDRLAHRAAQAILLRILDGAFSLDVPGLPGPTPDELRSLCFIGLGVFSSGGGPEGIELSQLLERDSRSIGFVEGGGARSSRNSATAALVRYGLGPEVVSRFSLQVGLEAPEYALLARVAAAPDGPLAILRQDVERFGLRLEIPAEAMDAVITLGLRIGGGIRGLEAATGELGWILRSALLREGNDCAGWRVEAATVRGEAAPVRLPGRPAEGAQSIPQPAWSPALEEAPLDAERARLFPDGAYLPVRPARHPDSDPQIRLANATELAVFHRPIRRENRPSN